MVLFIRQPQVPPPPPLLIIIHDRVTNQVFNKDSVKNTYNNIKWKLPMKTIFRCGITQNFRGSFSPVIYFDGDRLFFGKLYSMKNWLRHWCFPGYIKYLEELH